MDITVTSTGRTFWRIDDGVATLLCEAFPESFARVERTPTAERFSNAPTGARFSVGTWPVSGKALIKVSDGRQELYFSGDPKDLPTFKFALAGGCFAPEEIQRQYAAMYNPNSLDAQLEGQAEALLQRGYRKER